MRLAASDILHSFDFQWTAQYYIPEDINPSYFGPSPSLILSAEEVKM
jgi:hypothetical protein